MAVDMFLKIDGVLGDSTDPQHQGEIELLSFDWGEANPAAAAHSAGGGGGAGKAVMQDFHFVARSSQASPRLMLACSTAYPLKEAILTVRKAGSQATYMKLKLTDLVVSNYLIGLLRPSGELIGLLRSPTAGELNPPSDRPTPGAHNPPSDEPADSFSLNVARLEFEYRAQQPDGSLGAPVLGMAGR